MAEDHYEHSGNYTFLTAFRLRMRLAFSSSLGEVFQSNKAYYSSERDSLRIAKRKAFNPFKWVELLATWVSALALFVFDLIDACLGELVKAFVWITSKATGFNSVLFNILFGLLPAIALFGLILARSIYKSAYTVAFHTYNFALNYVLAPVDTLVRPLIELFQKGNALQKTILILLPLLLTALAVTVTMMAVGVVPALLFLQPLASFITPAVTFLSGFIGAVSTQVVFALGTLVASLILSERLVTLAPLSTFATSMRNALHKSIQGAQDVNTTHKYIAYKNEKSFKFVKSTGFSRLLYNTPDGTFSVDFAPQKTDQFSLGRQTIFALRATVGAYEACAKMGMDLSHNRLNMKTFDED